MKKFAIVILIAAALAGSYFLQKKLAYREWVARHRQR